MRCIVAGLIAATGLCGQQPDMPELLQALARTASFFSRTSPSLTAHEVLEQRARRGNMRVLRRGRHDELKEVAFTIPDTFEQHIVISDYRLGTPREGGFHEIRDIRSIDGQPPAAVRHAMTIGAETAEDESKKRLLEDLELERLQGAATDFGPLLLLFGEGRQSNMRFTVPLRKAAESGAVWVLSYRQADGEGGLTEFRNSREKRHAAEGQIWFRETDLLPLHITMNTEEALTSKFSLRNEAAIDYQPTPYGLAPRMVVHRQYLNQDLLVENRFLYSDYGGLEIIP